MSTGSLLNALMAASDAKTPDAVRLKSLGRRAAEDYVQHGTNLNDAVRTLVKEAGLNPSQTQRVVESANVETFAMKLSAGGGFRTNITFPMADTREVLAGPGLAKTASARSSAAVAVPVFDKWAAAGLSRHDIAAGGAPLEKVAKAAQPSQSEIRAEIMRLNRAAREGADVSSELESTFKMKVASLRSYAKQAVHGDGDPPWAVAAAVAAASPSRELFSFVVEELGPKLADVPGFLKTASAEVAVEANNPITGLIQDLDALLLKLQANESFVAATRDAATQLRDFLVGPPPQDAVDETFAQRPAVQAPPAPAPEQQMQLQAQPQQAM